MYTIDAAASDNIETAINNGTADMNFAIRYLARRITAQTNPRYERIQISRNDTTISVQFDARKPIEMPADGQSVPWVREDGGKDDLSAQWTATQLVMHFKSGDGERVYTIVLQPDRVTLKLNVKLVSSHFSAPINYVLAYRRPVS